MSKPIRTNKRKLNGDDTTVTKKSSNTPRTKKLKFSDGFMCKLDLDDSSDDKAIKTKRHKKLKTPRINKPKYDTDDDDAAKFIGDMNSLIKGLYDKDNNKKTVEKDFISIKSNFPNAKSLNDFYEEKKSI